MNQLLQYFRAYIRQEGLFRPNDRLLVGVSGGLDSVVLCHLLKECDFDFEIAHVNFGLRGADSNRDETFVASLAGKLGAQAHFMQAQTMAYATERKVSIQVAARDIRYNWFEDLISSSKAKGPAKPLAYILTAHHANDNAETVLMNIFRGTGLAGLRGILPARDLVRRPLLFASRANLEKYAAEYQLTWVEDSTNSLDKYTRNFVRNKVIPLVESHYPTLINNLNEAAKHARETNAFLDAAMDNLLRKLVIVKGKEQMIPVKRWSTLPGKAAILFHWIKEFGFSPAQLNDLVALEFSQTGHYVDSSSHRILRNRDWLVLTLLETRSSGLILLQSKSGSIDFPNGRLKWSVQEQKTSDIPATASMAFLDAGQLEFPVILRPWKAGDYFYPLGMPRKKKVARFLTDVKLSRTEKDKIWVLESGQRIFWVIGQRIDDRFKIRPSTRFVVQFEFTSGDG